MTLPEVDFELETWRMVLFQAGPRAGEIPEEMARELRARHLSAARQQQAAGTLLFAGAVPEPSSSLPVTGVAFFRTSEAETRAILDADPAEQAGLIATEIVGFVCPRGTLG
ncbi:YciI family protein [Amycolatopsis sp. RTGN1]|uniref:YciI family protein n=1 Tax=Amycolatopsis ponsaeliensis TaxID=2992142 RepID=UPI00254A6C60|nr:YciI family protein [Amycolatopsis sp. RTGN1]